MLATLSKALADHQAAHHEAIARLASTEAKLRDAKDEQAFWEQMAVQKLLGHSDVRTTMIYTHVLNRDRRGVRSPLD